MLEQWFHEPVALALAQAGVAIVLALVVMLLARQQGFTKTTSQKGNADFQILSHRLRLGHILVTEICQSTRETS